MFIVINIVTKHYTILWCVFVFIVAVRKSNVNGKIMVLWFSYGKFVFESSCNFPVFASFLSTHLLLSCLLTFFLLKVHKKQHKSVFYMYRMSWRVSQLKILWADPRCTGLRWVRLLERPCTVMTYHTPMVNFSSQSWQAPDHMPKSRKINADSLTVLTLKTVRHLCVQSLEWMNEYQQMNLLS